MKINVSEVLTTIDKKPLKVDGADMTLKDACIRALFALSNEDMKRQSGQEKMDRYTLGLKINKGGEVDLTVDEAAKVKGLIGETFGPVVVGPAWLLLEGKESKRGRDARDTND